MLNVHRKITGQRLNNRDREERQVSCILPIITRKIRFISLLKPQLNVMKNFILSVNLVQTVVRFSRLLTKKSS